MRHYIGARGLLGLLNLLFILLKLFLGGGGQSETFPWSCVAAVTTLFKKHANGNSFGSVDMTVKISMAFDSLKISECKSHFLLGQIRCISRDRYLLHRT